MQARHFLFNAASKVVSAVPSEHFDKDFAALFPVSDFVFRTAWRRLRASSYQPVL